MCFIFFRLWQAMLMEGHQGYSLRNSANYIIRDVCPLARMELSPNRILWGGWCSFRWGMEGKGIERELEFAKGFSWCPGPDEFHTSSRGQQCTNVSPGYVGQSSKIVLCELAMQWAWDLLENISRTAKLGLSHPSFPLPPWQAHFWFFSISWEVNECLGLLGFNCRSFLLIFWLLCVIWSFCSLTENYK